jgi:selenocysteine lyase/cysteine desulfurase
MLKAHYSRFLAADPGRLHFAAHSHHYWPDVTREAVVRCWDDAARLADRKWDHLLGEVVPRAQAHVARLLGLSRPQDIALAPNTHELVARLLSCFDEERPLRVLTTDAEFHSFARQIARHAELPRVRVTRVPSEPFASFERRFGEAAASGHDLVYVSHVFYDSGYAADVEALVAGVRGERTLVAIDGYHAFAALPVSLAALERRVFYLAGGYKYAQAGEGACFMHVPPGCELRPLDTGWFARMPQLGDRPGARVEYPDDGYRFWGATFDATGLYRFNAVMDWLLELGVSTADVHAHVRALQRRFLELLEELRLPQLPPESLVTPRDLARQGHFLAFRLPHADALAQALAERKVVADARGDRLRFGFGPYHDAGDVERLAERLRTL